MRVIASKGKRKPYDHLNLQRLPPAPITPLHPTSSQTCHPISPRPSLRRWATANPTSRPTLAPLLATSRTCLPSAPSRRRSHSTSQSHSSSVLTNHDWFVEARRAEPIPHLTHLTSLPLLFPCLSPLLSSFNRDVTQVDKMGFDIKQVSSCLP